MQEYSIQMVSSLTGLSLHTLRTWEKRYQVVCPKRNSSGHRVYSEEEVFKLKVLNDLCILGCKIGELSHKTIEQLKSLGDNLGLNKTYFNPLQKVVNKTVDGEKSLNNILLALNEFKLDIISHELYKIKLLISPREFVLDILSPLMNQIGQKFSEGNINIAQEHAISSIIKFHLGDFVYKNYEENKRGKKLIVLTTPENELHEFGILLASLLCFHHAYNFFYLGPNLPAKALVEASKSLNADSIILGTTSSTCPSESSFLTDYITTVLGGIGKEKQLIVGGGGFFNTRRFKKRDNFDYFPTFHHLDQFLGENLGS